VKRSLDTEVDIGEDSILPSSDTFGSLAPVQEDALDSEEEDDGMIMPNVKDHDEAGFVPTREQPFRRVRRYTIT
jgi:hypothetical protein